MPVAPRPRPADAGPPRPRRGRRALLVILALVAAAAIAPAPARAGTVVTPTAPVGVIRSGVPWYDDNGQAVNAHGAGIIKVGTTYYLIGEKRTTANLPYDDSGTEFETNFVGFQCYASQDLMHWSDQGIALGVGASGTAVDGTSVNERPKIVYNASTSTYVMFFHQWSDHAFGYATSSSPCSGYTYRGTLQNSSGTKVAAGDTSAYVDTDGKGYLLTSGGTIYALAADYLSVTNTVATGIFSSAEAPALFKAGGTYFLLSSSLTWWRSNENFYATATSLAGPWTARNGFAPSGSKTHNSQTTFVLPVTGSAGTTYMYMGDRWCNACLPSSTYVWQPLTVSGTTLSMPTYRPQWSIDVNRGTWSEVSDGGTTVNDATLGSGTLQFSYGPGWQTSGCATGDGCNNSDNTYSNTTDAVAHMRFTGTQASLYSVVDPNHGQVAASICDADRANCGAETLVNLYAPARAANTLVWASPVKAYGTWSVKLRVAGAKTPYSTGSYVTIDRMTVATDVLNPHQFYKLVNRNSGKLLNVNGASLNEGASAIQYPDGPGRNAHWAAVPVGDGYVKLVVRHSLGVLDVPGASTATGVQLHQWSYLGQTNQQWSIGSSGGYLTLTARSNHLLAEVNGSSTADLAAVVQRTSSGGTNQQWTATPVTF